MARIGPPRGLIDDLALDDRPPVTPGAHAPVRPMGSDADGGAPAGVPPQAAAARGDLAGGTTTADPAPGAPATAPYAADVPILAPSSRDCGRSPRGGTSCAPARSYTPCLERGSDWACRSPSSCGPRSR